MLIPIFQLKLVEYLAVDMGGAMGDDTVTDEYTVSICVKDAGPYHYDFRQHLVALAKEQDIPFSWISIRFMVRTLGSYSSAGAEVNASLELVLSQSLLRTNTHSVVATERMVDTYLKSALDRGR